MAQLEDFVNFSDFWPTVLLLDSKAQAKIFQQVVDRLQNFGDESIANIIDGLPSAYKSRLWSIWLQSSDLTKYSVKELSKMAMEFDGRYAKELWLRWLAQKDLRDVNLVAFAQGIRELSPEAQLACLQEYYHRCPNILQYGRPELEKVAKTLSSWAIMNLGQATRPKPKFGVGDPVRLLGRPYTDRVESIYDAGDGVWRYWLRQNNTRFYREDEIQEV